MDLSKDDLKIFTTRQEDFSFQALEIFRFQYNNNPVYHEYVNALKVDAASVKTITQIPFLPIRFFKSHPIQTTSFDPEIVFESSGTTGSINSKHRVKKLLLYEKSFLTGFEDFYGLPAEWCIIGLLPAYLERQNSSLVYMINELIDESKHSHSGFYLKEYDKLFDVLNELESAKQKTILVGVTFALLDFAEKHSLSLEHTIIMETGGMKGRREEKVREEVHTILKDAFGDLPIHSEYGMTELLSQAYSKANGVFHCPAWMRVLIRDEADPLSVIGPSGDGLKLPAAGLEALGHNLAVTANRQPGPDNHSLAVTPVRGAINIIDLANIYSCSFIATDDAGKLYNDGSFEVLGRIDNSDIRGCSLMAI